MNSENVSDIIKNELNDDLALDFVEHEVGGNNFVSNWNRLKKSANVRQKIQHWLDQIGAKEASAETIERIIDDIASKGTTWLTPFTSPIPPEE